MTLYKPKNRVGDTLASDFVHGTDSSLTLNSASDFRTTGGYILIDDNNEWALYEYTGVSTNDLTGLTSADAINESISSHTFSSGSDVYLVQAADVISDIVDILKGDTDWPASQKIGDDTKILFGTDTDYSIKYDSANDRLEVYDEGASSMITTIESSGNIDTQGNTVTNQATTWSDFNNLDLSNVANFSQSNLITVSAPTVAIPDGDDLILHRETLGAGKSIKVLAAGIAQDDGTTGTTSLELQVYNNTDSSSIYSTTGINRGSYSSPLGSGGTADEVIIRLSNSTGSSQNCQGYCVAVVE